MVLTRESVALSTHNDHLFIDACTMFTGVDCNTSIQITTYVFCQQHFSLNETYNVTKSWHAGTMQKILLGWRLFDLRQQNLGPPPPLPRIGRIWAAPTPPLQGIIGQIWATYSPTYFLIALMALNVFYGLI